MAQTSSLIITAAICLTAIFHPEVVSGDGGNQKPYTRLPTALSPVNYKVVIKPLMYKGPKEDFKFEGAVKILLKCMEATNNITLHSKDLAISNTSISLVTSDDSPVPAIQSYHLDPIREFIIFYLDSDLVAGREYVIGMDFTGPLKADRKGLYLSSYKENNETVYLAATQFQVADARKAFPCLDEPGFKATFDIEIVRRRGYCSISNMPLLRQKKLKRSKGMTVDVYKTTPKMSTYLVAFIISKFKKREALTSKRVEVRVWADPGKIDQTERALSSGVKILEYFEDYFGVDYMLPKIDMVALPDFAFMVAENWGLTTYRESALLYKPESSPPLTVAFVVSHAFVHQWFGDLVTPAWWNDLWLNEGFATLMLQKGVDLLHPDWLPLKNFVPWYIHKALKLDGLKSSHPIYLPVNDYNDVYSNLDAITYFKSASVLRMLEHYLGESIFKQGLKKFLMDNKYASVGHDALWKAMDDVVGKSDNDISVKEMMDTWILQMNYPVVNVEIDKDNAIQISQNRFLSNKDAEENLKYPSKFGYKWHIPFSYTSSIKPDFNNPRVKLMNKDATEEEIHDPSTLPKWTVDPDAWVIGNVLQSGVYRVNYEEGNWNALIKQLINNHKKAIQKLLAKQYKRLGWETKTGPETSLQDIMLRMACSYDVEGCRKEASRLYKKWMSNATDNIIPVSLKRMVYCYGISEGDTDEWAFGYNMYKSANDAAEQRILLEALACTEVPELLERYLGYCLDPDEIHPQNARKAFSDIASSRAGQSPAWDFLRENYADFLQTFGETQIPWFVKDVTSDFSTEERLNELKQFVQEGKDFLKGNDAVNQAIETVESNIKWLNKMKPILSSWVRNQGI